MVKQNKTERKERVRKVTVEQIENALKKTMGNLTRAASYLKQYEKIEITRQALFYRVSKSKRLQEAQKEARETVVDIAESVVVDELAKRNWKVALSILRTLGKNRGYTQEIIRTDSKDIEDKNNSAELLTQVLQKVWEEKHGK